jgi:hypothetical protein
MMVWLIFLAIILFGILPIAVIMFVLYELTQTFMAIENTLFGVPEIHCEEY